MTAKKEKVVENPVDSVDGVDLSVVNVASPTAAKTTVKKTSILRNTRGEVVPEGDYFFAAKGKVGVAPNSFTKICGYAVDREDLVEVFDRVFNPKDNFLFYKSGNKEVYIIIVPLKYSISVGVENDSVEGDFQKHAISFIGEGSVNLDTLKSKLMTIKKFANFETR